LYKKLNYIHSSQGSNRVKEHLSSRVFIFEHLARSEQKAGVTFQNSVREVLEIKAAEVAQQPPLLDAVVLCYLFFW
jgi:hypothetical protein